ncbi:MAG: putative metal-dependent hydrolase [Pedobacter sp.]|nr:MAG: putative metal-dependent hydrolase [Pedobacter sp.]
MTHQSPDPRYPIGNYIEREFSEGQKKQWIGDIRYLPGLIEYSIQNLDEAQLDEPYRPGGWTIRQVVHHVADSHMNAYIRFKLGLTENNPTIKPYEEALWAELADTRIVPINVSLTILHALHLRWVAVLDAMTDEDFLKTVYHPEKKHDLTLWYLLGSYAWHGRHHVAHITSLREGKNW